MSMEKCLLEAVAQKRLRPLDAQFALAVAGPQEPAVMLAAALLSREVGKGHVCLPLSHLAASESDEPLLAQLRVSAGEPEAWPACLLASAAVSAGERATPLVLNNDRLYLNRMWHNELTVAKFFSAASHTLSVDEQRLGAMLDRLFATDDEINWQKVAAAVALTRRVAVISGGPGTGKTTTVAKLLAALILMSDGAKLRISLAAPTGKAAARLTESLVVALGQLPLSDKQKQMLPQEASTLHRLLGAQPGSQRLRYHGGNPLHLDVLVVDEASMIDLSMMARLIHAMPPRGRVIFLGDRDQLASVEAGAVLGDICAWASVGYTPARARQLTALTGTLIPAGASTGASALRDSLCLLQKSYRFGSNSGIGQLAAAVNRGDKRAIQSVFTRGFTGIGKKPLRTRDDYMAMLDDALTGYQRYLALLRAAASPADLMAAFSEYQLLCALRDGPFGVSGLNQHFERLLLQKRLIACPSPGGWYAGRPVMITRNDSAPGLFNGDIGIALDSAQGLRVWFPMPDGGIRPVHPGRLPQHETAWAMTVHKAQGSEFDHAALILPDKWGGVTREMIYTAITRARRRISLYADDGILAYAIATGIDRRSGLAAIFGNMP